MNDLGEPKLRYNWQTPIWLSRHNQDVLYYGANKFYRSLDKAETMVALSGDLTNGKKSGNVPFGTFTTIHESPLKFGLIYIGTDDGNIQVTKDGGYTWALININKSLPKTPAGLWVSRVTASAFKEGRVFATLNGYRFDHFLPYLFVSEDFGNTWKQLGMDLPAEPLNVVKEDPKNENIIYVGSDNGLYVSFDQGKSFTTLGSLPRVPVHDLTIQTRENELVVGTHGRSIYITSLDTVQKVYELQLKSQQAKAFLKVDDTRQTTEAEITAGTAATMPEKNKAER